MGTNKSFSTETSERYSRALFEVAEENSELDKIENSLSEFLNLYNSSQELISFIKNPTQSNANQLQAIELISKKFNFGKLNPLDIIWVPIKISILLFLIFLNNEIVCSFFFV